jgi:tetratricopeptide (TPR) repeat protein
MKYFIVVIFISVFTISCGQDDEATNNVTGEQSQLINDLKKQVQQNPDSAGVRMKLVNALDSARMYKEAITQTDSLIKRDSLNNGLWFTKALLLESNKDTTEAIKSYERALNIYPSVETQLNLANLLAETKDARSLLICSNVSGMGLGRGTDASCNFIAGVYYARSGKNQQALNLFDKAINDNYTLMEAYMEKGFISYESRSYADAIKVFETAITVNKMYPDAYYWKAKCFEAMGNREEALVNYKRSLGLDKNLKEAADAIKRLSS